MPWSSIANVPDNVKHHDGATLTLAQANFVANIADNAEGADSPWAVAWAQFKKKYKKSEDGKKWVKKKKESTRPIAVAIPLARFDRVEDVMDVEACIEFVRGDIEVTEETFDTIITNFESNAVGRDIYVDIAHYTENPKKQKSAWDNINLGTVKEFKKGISAHPDAEGKKTLIASIAWNKKGREAIEQGLFNYLSLTFYPEWTHVGTDEEVGPTATSIAVTNDPYAPFLQKIGEKPKIAASRIVIEDGKPKLLQEGRKGGSTVKKKKKSKVELAEIGGVSTQDLRDNLESALSDGIEGDVYPWVKDIKLNEDGTGGTAIYEMQGELKGRAFALAEDGTVILEGEPFEVSQKTDYEKVEPGAESKPALPPEPEKKEEEPIEADRSTKGGSQVADEEKKALERKAQDAETALKLEREKVIKLQRVRSLARRRRMLSHITRPINGKVLPPAVKTLLENIMLGSDEKDKEMKPVLLSRLSSVKQMFQGNGGEGGEIPAAETVTEVVAAVDELVEEVKAEAEATAEEIVEAEIPEETKESELEVLRAQIAALVEQIRALGEVPVTQETTQESEKPAEGGGEGAELARLADKILEEKKDKKLFTAEGKPRFTEREMTRKAQLIAEKKIKKGGN